jgi:hypothetical protein
LKFTGRFVAAATARAVARSSSGVITAQPSEPSPPAFDTAVAIAGVEAPAIGAWTMGCSTPIKRCKRSVGHMAHF